MAAGGDVGETIAIEVSGTHNADRSDATLCEGDVESSVAVAHSDEDTWAGASLDTVRSQPHDVEVAVVIEIAGESLPQPLVADVRRRHHRAVVGKRAAAVAEPRPRNRLVSRRPNIQITVVVEIAGLEERVARIDRQRKCDRIPGGKYARPDRGQNRH